MGQLPLCQRSSASVNDLDLLLSRAREIASGTDFWARPQLREDFAALVRAGQDPLGDRYSALRTAAYRRLQGITLTPRRIVKAMTDWAEREAKALGTPRRVIDPGAGTGRFSIAAALRFPEAEIFAVENDPDLASLLRANLRASRLEDRVEVVSMDFRNFQPQEVPGPTLFIGNPPYVRHHGISADWKEWYVNACFKYGIVASRLAGLHLHFFSHILEIGRGGDFGCLITAAEWLDVGYGGALRSLLAHGLGGSEIHVLHPAAEAFPGTMSTAAITGFRIGQRPPTLRLRNVDESAQLDPLEGGRSIPWAELSQEPKWSILVRDTPKPSPGSIELGELCKVHRGQVTGNNRVWIAGSHTRDLPGAFLKPTVTRAAELIKAAPTLDDDRQLARVVDLPSSLDEIEPVERERVERFIRWAKAAGAAAGYIARHRSPWWSVRLRKPAPIVCTYMARRIPAFVLNPAGAHILNIAHGIYPREELGDAQLRQLRSVLQTSVRQQQGRTYSGGLIKFEPSEVERIAIPTSWIRTDAIEQPSTACLDA
jgi:Met-10+ like-protein